MLRHHAHMLLLSLSLAFIYLMPDILITIYDDIYKMMIIYHSVASQ